MKNVQTLYDVLMNTVISTPIVLETICISNAENYRGMFIPYWRGYADAIPQEWYNRKVKYITVSHNALVIGC